MSPLLPRKRANEQDQPPALPDGCIQLLGMPIFTYHHIYHLYERGDGGYQWERVPFPGVGKLVGLNWEATDEDANNTSVLKEDRCSAGPTLINDVIQEKVSELARIRRLKGRDNSVKWVSFQVILSAVVGNQLPDGKFYLHPR